MASFKRRRAVGIDIGYHKMLKSEYKKRGLETHTSLANAILKGTQRPLPYVSPAKLEGKRKSISMQEYVWLALRNRARLRGGSSTAQTTASILRGEALPLSGEELTAAMKEAEKREEKRARESGLIRQEKTDIAPEPIEWPFSTPAEEAPDKNSAKEQSPQAPISPPSSDIPPADKEIEGGPEFYSGVFFI